MPKMRKQMYFTASAAILTAGLIGGAPAVALADPQTDGSGGVLSGNQINVPVDVKAELCGNSLAALGISEADCTKVAKILYAAGEGGEDGAKTDGSAGVASGNQVNMPVDTAIELCGNSAAVGGVSEADCTEVVHKLAKESDDSGDAPKTDGSGGVASGNQVNIPVDAAIDVCGNSIAILGVSEADCTTVVEEMSSSKKNEGAKTDGSAGVASGNQVNIPVDAAVDICGNSASVVGVSEAECLEKISSGSDGDDGKGGDKGDDGKDSGGGDNGGDDGKDSGDNGGGKDQDKGADQPGTPGDGGDKGDGAKQDPPADQVADESPSTGGLPVTGAALGGLIAAAVAAIGGGGAAMYAARKRKAATAAAESEDDA